MSMPLILLGLLFSVYSPQMYYLVYAGIACFGLAALFQLVTLPTEFNASRRALAAIESGNLLYEEEIRGARKTLRCGRPSPMWLPWPSPSPSCFGSWSSLRKRAAAVGIDFNMVALSAGKAGESSRPLCGSFFVDGRGGISDGRASYGGSGS